MVEYYLEKGTTATINPPLGYSLLDINSGVTVNKQFIIIQAEKGFNYYNQQFTDALAEGVISNAEYSAIIANQGASRQVYELAASYTFDKNKLIDLIDVHGLPITTAGKTAPELTDDIINAGYYVVFNPLFSVPANFIPSDPPSDGIGQDFAADSTNTAILFKDIDTGAIERTEHINTLVAAPNADGINLTIQYTGAEVVIIDKLYLDKTYINGVLVTQVVATAAAELNALFAHTGSIGNAPTITGGPNITINLTHTFSINYVLTGTDIVAINWDISTTGTVPDGHIFTPEGDHRRILGGASLAVGTYLLYVTVTNYYGSATATITLNVSLPPFSNTKSWNPQTSNNAYFRDDTAGQENNNVFYRSGATGSPWSVFGWAKTTRTSGWQANKHRPFINFGGDPATDGCVRIWYKRHNSYFHRFYVKYGDNSNYVWGVEDFLNSTGTWFSWAVVYDGTATTSGSPFVVYINGAAVTPAWTVGGSGYSGTVEYQTGDDDSKLHIAKVFGQSNVSNETAYVDDIGCWASAKSASDISTYHNSGTPLNLGAYSPHSYFRFGDVPTDITAYPTLTNEGATGNNITAYLGTVGDYVSDVP